MYKNTRIQLNWKGKHDLTKACLTVLSLEGLKKNIKLTNIHRWSTRWDATWVPPARKLNTYNRSIDTKRNLFQWWFSNWKLKLLLKYEIGKCVKFKGHYWKLMTYCHLLETQEWHLGQLSWQQCNYVDLWTKCNRYKVEHVSLQTADKCKEFILPYLLP